MQVKVNPGSMLTTAMGLYFLILLTALAFWPENWVDPSSVEIIIFSLGMVVGGMLVQLLYQISFDDKQDEVDLYLSQSEEKINQQKSELNLQKENVKERENFLLEAIDRLTPDSNEQVEDSEELEDLEEIEDSGETEDLVEVEDLEEIEDLAEVEDSEEIEDLVEVEDSEERSDEVDYDSMTVSQLKNILKEKELSTSGKKSDLIARLK